MQNHIFVDGTQALQHEFKSLLNRHGHPVPPVIIVDMLSSEEGEIPINMFLEKYALDVMRLYAPVDGTKIGCAPKIFVESKIRKDIVNGLAANIPSLKLKGDYYDLSSKAEQYFVGATRAKSELHLICIENIPSILDNFDENSYKIVKKRN